MLWSLIDDRAYPSNQFSNSYHSTTHCRPQNPNTSRTPRATHRAPDTLLLHHHHHHNSSRACSPSIPEIPGSFHKHPPTGGSIVQNKNSVGQDGQSRKGSFLFRDGLPTKKKKGPVLPQFPRNLSSRPSMNSNRINGKSCEILRDGRLKMWSRWAESDGKAEKPGGRGNILRLQASLCGRIRNHECCYIRGHTAPTHPPYHG